MLLFFIIIIFHLLLFIYFYFFENQFGCVTGMENYDPSKGHHILVHSVEEAEVKNKPPKQAQMGQKYRP